MGGGAEGWESPELTVLQRLLPAVVILGALRFSLTYPHSNAEKWKTQAQRASVTCLKSPRLKVMELVFQSSGCSSLVLCFSIQHCLSGTEPRKKVGFSCPQCRRQHGLSQQPLEEEGRKEGRRDGRGRAARRVRESLAEPFGQHNPRQGHTQARQVIAAFPRSGLLLWALACRYVLFLATFISLQVPNS